MSSLRYSAPRPSACHLFCALLLSLLTACGGGGPAEPASKNASAADPSPANITETEEAALARGAALSVSTLADAEKKALAADASQSSSAAIDNLRPGQAAPKSAYTSGAVARKALALRISAYRFYNRSSAAHFYTVSEAERDNVIARLSPPFNYEGSAFSVASAYSPGLSPVHRFYNTRNGVHFYTISEAERAHVVANLPFYTYEGVAYHASEVAGNGLIPFYRFFVPSKGFHFYTASEEEKNNVIANLGAAYRYEGIGYYVLDTDWRAEKLPHTGITNEQCQQAGSDSLVACSSSGATGLNPQQDGHRAGINPMSYSEVPNPAGGSFPITSCVRDNVTGLVWEGKEASGVRAGKALYTNQGDGSLTDASGYLNIVNASKLCGFSDWRLPTRQELLNIRHFGRASGLAMDVTWFPNSEVGSGGSVYADNYWTSDALGPQSAYAWFVDFGQNPFISEEASNDNAYAVRLVRGRTSGGPRYTYSSIAYGNDAANNLVNDAWTGLQWRRCLEGKTWNGVTCTGTTTLLNHEQALTHARQQTGWRLPNIKELASLSVLGQPDVPIDVVTFPGATGWAVRASSSAVGGSTRSFVVDFPEDSTLPKVNLPKVQSFSRSIASVTAARLVRINP